MKYIKALLPEILFCLGGLIIFIGLLFATHWGVAVVFLGCFVLITANYINSIMSLEVE